MSSNPRGKGKSISENNVNPMLSSGAPYIQGPQFATPQVQTNNPSMLINNGAQLTRDNVPQAYPGYPQQQQYGYQSRPPPPTVPANFQYMGYNQQPDHTRDNYVAPYYPATATQQQYWPAPNYNRYQSQMQMNPEFQNVPTVPPPVVPAVQGNYNSEASSLAHSQMPEPRKKKILLIADPETGVAVNINAADKPATIEQPKITSSLEDEEKKKTIVKDMMSKMGSEITTVDKTSPEVAATVEPVKSDEVPLEAVQPSQSEEVADKSEEESHNEIPSVEPQVPEPCLPASLESKTGTCSTELPCEEVIDAVQPSISTDILVEEAPVCDDVIPEENAATALEPEEDAQKRAEEEEERRRMREEELDNLLDSLMEDVDECDRNNMAYNRRFLYCVRDIEREFHRTTCPLTPAQLEDFGIDLKSMPKSGDGKKRADFNPSWAQRPSMGNRAKYQSRPSDRGRVNPRKPYQSRASIDRPAVDRKISLGNKAENAWKPEKLSAEQMEDAESKLKILLKKVRSLMNKITPTTKEELTNEFLSYQVTVAPENSELQETQITQVIDIIFDKAVEEPKFCPLYSELCKIQVNAELKKDSKVSVFRNLLLTRAQQTFQTKNQVEEERAEKVSKIDAEEDARRKQQLQSELDEFDSKFRRRKFGNIIFIGQLFQQQLLSTKIVVWCLFDLINHTHPNKDGVCPEPPYDEESLQCAAQLLNSLGKQLEVANDFKGDDYLNQTLKHLQQIAPKCSNKIRFLLLGVIELRRNKWIPRKTVEQGPKKIDEIHQDIKKEQAETQAQRDSYERKAGLRMGGGSMRGPNRNAPPQRNSYDRNATSARDKRSAAASSAKLAGGGATAPKKTISLSQVDQNTSKKSWRSGAGGGGTSENKSAWGDKNGSQDVRKSSVAGNSQRDLASRRSSSQQSIASQEAEAETEDQKKEKQEKFEKIVSRIKSDFEEMRAGDSKMEEFVQQLIDLQKEEKFGCPDVKEIFSRFMFNAVKNLKPDSLDLLKFGTALRRSLLNKEHRSSIVHGVSRFCKKAVDEDMPGDYPHCWPIVAELIFYATHPVDKEGLEESKTDTASATVQDFSATVQDFEEAFIEAAKPDNDYKMLVLVLRRIVDEIHRHVPVEDEWISNCSWTFSEFGFLKKKLDQDKLERALQETKADAKWTLLDIYHPQ